MDSITILSYKVEDLHKRLERHEERLKNLENAVLKFNEMLTAFVDRLETATDEIDVIKYPLG